MAMQSPNHPGSGHHPIWYINLCACGGLRWEVEPCHLVVLILVSGWSPKQERDPFCVTGPCQLHESVPYLNRDSNLRHLGNRAHSTYLSRSTGESVLVMLGRGWGVEGALSLSPIALLIAMPIA